MEPSPQTLFESVREEARGFFHDAKGSHDWEHTERVLALALRLAEAGGADAETVALAAVLHDIARGEEDRSGGRIDHALRGAELARGLLARRGLAAERVERVAHCIETHRFRSDRRPRTLEAEVLFDADKLDAIGAVGVGRAFLFAGEVGARLHNPDADWTRTRPYSEEDTAYREYMVKLRRVRDRVLTPAGRRLAEERHDFMTAFFERLNAEVRGER